MVEGDAQHQGHVTCEHDGGGGKQLYRTYQRRKVRMKDGVSRDRLLQLDMFNFTQHTVRNSGVGGSSDVNLGSPGSVKVRK